MRFIGFIMQEQFLLHLNPPAVESDLNEISTIIFMELKFNLGVTVMESVSIAGQTLREVEPTGTAREKPLTSPEPKGKPVGSWRPTKPWHISGRKLLGCDKAGSQCSQIMGLMKPGQN